VEEVASRDEVELAVGFSLVVELPQCAMPRARKPAKGAKRNGWAMKVLKAQPVPPRPPRKHGV
jgi:hypothetical protein